MRGGDSEGLGRSVVIMATDIPSDPIDVAIAAVAVRQQGNITRQQLLQLGLGPAAIAYRVKVGRLHRVYPGVYAVGRPPSKPLERAAAAVLACGPHAVLSHGSAMTLWGLQKQWPTPFEVTVKNDRRPGEIKVHRSQTLGRPDLTRQLGVPVTSPERTIFDRAPNLNDRSLARAVNDALLSGFLNRSDLAELLRRLPHRPHAHRLANFIVVEHGPTRSDWEDMLPAFCRQYDLPEPIMSANVLGYTADALFPREKVIIELDSFKFHSSRDSFESDRNRDADMLAARYVTVRITWERFTLRPRQEADRLHAILRTRRS
jgi:hypothetical protein